MTVRAALALSLGLSAWSARVGATESDVSTPEPPSSPARAVGMAEVGLGWLVLPAADVCVERDIAGCTTGDSSLELDAWQTPSKVGLASPAGWS